MYLVIGPSEKGFWIAQVANKEILLNNLNKGYYKDKWVGQTDDLVFIEELPEPLAMCATMEEFKPNEVLIVECKVVVPEAVKVTTQYKLEDY